MALDPLAPRALLGLAGSVLARVDAPTKRGLARSRGPIRRPDFWWPTSLSPARRSTSRPGGERRPTYGQACARGARTSGSIASTDPRPRNRTWSGRRPVATRETFQAVYAPAGCSLRSRTDAATSSEGPSDQSDGRNPGSLPRHRRAIRVRNEISVKIIILLRCRSYS